MIYDSFQARIILAGNFYPRRGPLKPPHQQADTTPELLSPQRAARQAKFKQIRRAISPPKTGDPNVPDYHTGRASKFALKRYDARQRQEEDESGKLCFWPRRRVEIPFGPNFKTPQFQRTLDKPQESN